MVFGADKKDAIIIGLAAALSFVLIVVVIHVLKKLSLRYAYDMYLYYIKMSKL